jgi:hypothetical protein
MKRSPSWQRSRRRTGASWRAGRASCRPWRSASPARRISSTSTAWTRSSGLRSRTVAVQAVGKRIRTVEGLAQGDTLHPLQTAFMTHHALQCGFCTPGFLMLAVNVLERTPDISDEEMLDVLSSNLCRCTGYQNIIKTVRSVAADMRAAGGR